MNLISVAIIVLITVQISEPCKSDGIAKVLYISSRDCLCAKFYFIAVLGVPKICKNALNFEVVLFHFL